MIAAPVAVWFVGGAVLLVGLLFLAALVESVLEENRDPQPHPDSYWVGRLFWTTVLFGIVAVCALTWLATQP